MYYGTQFRPKVKAVEIEDEGEKFTFYLRKPSGMEMVRAADVNAQKKKIGKEDTNEVANRESLSKYVVHEDGSSITPEEVESLMGMNSSAFRKLSDALIEEITGRPIGDTKNA